MELTDVVTAEVDEQLFLLLRWNEQMSFEQRWNVQMFFPAEVEFTDIFLYGRNLQKSFS
jgi:hypothetical protein